MIPTYWMIQIAFDLLLLILLLSLLRSRGRVAPESPSATPSEPPDTSWDDGFAQMTELRETLEALVNQVEKTTNRSLEQLQRLINEAEESRIVLEKRIESAREALQALQQVVSDTGGAGDECDTNKEETKADTILRLHGQGLAVEQIARQLGIGQGEVRLVLDLNRTGQQSK